MPYYRDVEVDILGDGGRSFKEYGVTKNYRMKMVSCFIQSETNERFRICIKAEEELLRRDQQQSEYEEGMILNYSANSPREGVLIKIPGAVDEFGRDNTLRLKPWHLLATVKLDGRSEIEKREFVLLDENDEIFPDDGLFIIKGATVLDENGVWKQYEWMFKDIGIDVTFENLQLGGGGGGGDQAAVPAQPEEDLVDAFSALGAIKTTETEERGKPGQIEVRLDRVTMGKTVYKKRSVSPDDQGGLKELQGAKIGDLGHMIGRSEGQEISERTRATYFEHMDDEDEPYAIFRFNYCDESMFTNRFGTC
jgi:hypothetical protein